jgi:hypothetical protein
MEIDPSRLSHWSRVAFAARCARRVQPLFAEAWPDATAARKEAVERAIALAERSVAERQVCDGLKEAMLGAVMAAGRALIPHLYPVPVETSEPTPADREAAVVASLAANVAGKAAEAALVGPQRSGEVAREAVSFALDAIRSAGRPGLVEVLEADFETADEGQPKRPWWRFW